MRIIVQWAWPLNISKDWPNLQLWGKKPQLKWRHRRSRLQSASTATEHHEKLFTRWNRVIYSANNRGRWKLALHKAKVQPLILFCQKATETRTLLILRYVIWLSKSRTEAGLKWIKMEMKCFYEYRRAAGGSGHGSQPFVLNELVAEGHSRILFGPFHN